MKMKIDDKHFAGQSLSNCLDCPIARQLQELFPQYATIEVLHKEVRLKPNLEWFKLIGGTTDDLEKMAAGTKERVVEIIGLELPAKLEYKVVSPGKTTIYTGFAVNARRDSEYIAVVKVEDSIETYSLDSEDMPDGLREYLTDIHGGNWSLVGIFKMIAAGH